MNSLKLCLLFLFSLSVACDVETRHCDANTECFAGERCIENSCLTLAEIQAQQNKDGGKDVDIDDNNSDSNNDIVVSCVENGTLNVGEECEKNLPLTQTCQTLGYDSGALKCTDCQFDTSNCVVAASTCGDGTAVGVACDGIDLAGKTCESEIALGSTGNLSCSANCIVNTSDCSTVYIHISASENHTCAVNSLGRIKCWGAIVNDDALLPLVGKYTQVSSGDDYSCGLKRNGEVVCWGAYFVSQLDVPEEKFATSLTSATRGSCAIKPDKTARCWGSRTKAPPEGEYSQISAGGTHGCGVSEGIIKCWGTVEDIPVPEADDGATFIQVEAGYNFSCALMSNENIVCWKTDGTIIETPLGNYTQISVSFSHTCALRTDQTVSCWGYQNDYGEDDPQSEKFLQVTAGRRHSCGITVGGEIKCWGKEDLIKIP